jgi:hypothetical protein
MDARSLQIITYLVTTIIVISLVVILFTAPGKAEADNGINLVPQWIKHVALWWSQGEISDDDFINGMTWLVENKILPVTDLVEELDVQPVPDSVKKIAYAWSQNNLSDSEFLRGIGYLIKNGMKDTH